MAHYYAPTTIFIDECDAICSKRGSDDGESSRRIKAEFLVQMDGCNTQSSANIDNEDKKEFKENNNNNEEPERPKLIMVLGATNRPWDLDEALIRRFEKRVYIPLPNEKGREELFKINLLNVKIEENIDFSQLIKITEGYSGADIANVCREASLMNMRRRLLGNQVNIEELIGKTGFRKDIEAPISENDLIDACKNICKSVSNDDLSAYEKWTEEFRAN
jgi:katanin p60 ATPase-containing subunit A1